MAFSYPRKQTVIIFIVSAVAVGATAYHVLGTRLALSSAGKIDVVAISTTPPNPVIAGTDNWKEQFVSASSIEKASAKNKPVAEPTLTENFGSDFFMTYLGLKQSGQTGNTALAASNFENVVSNAFNSTQAPTYKQANLRVVADSTPGVMENWKEGIVRALNLYTWTSNEGMILRDSVDNEDPELLKNIDPIVAGYTKIIATLLATPTPSSAQSTMLDLVNAFAQLKFSAQSFRAMGTDPVKSMTAINTYTVGTQKLMSALARSGDIMDGAGIELRVNSLVMDVPFRY